MSGRALRPPRLRPGPLGACGLTAALFINACLFGGDADHPAAPAALYASGQAPGSGWYRGDYGSLAEYGLESDLILTQDSLQFIGIRNNDAVVRMKARCQISASGLKLTQRVQSGVDTNAALDPWSAGVFDGWNALPDTTDSIIGLTGGEFLRKESVLVFFAVGSGGIPTIVADTPAIWVWYRPMSQGALVPAHYTYQEFDSQNPTQPFSVYRDFDLSRCDSGRFSSRIYFLGGEVFGAVSPDDPAGWWGYETQAAQWFTLGSFLVAKQFQERTIGQYGSGPWQTSTGDYLLRITRDPGQNGFFVWWNGNDTAAGFWTLFRQEDPQALCKTAVDPDTLFHLTQSP